MARKVILGTMEFGRRNLADHLKCQEIVTTFVSSGHKELDTALIYGNSEQILGEMAQCKNPDEVLMATKAHPWRVNDFKYDSVISQANTSLKNLQMPSVDLFYLHSPDHNTPILETLKAVDNLHKAGKFKRFGLSNYSSWQVSEIYYLCKQNNWILPSVYQGMYNGVCRMVEGELFSCLRHFGMAFYAYNPLAGGLLTGKCSYDDPEGKACQQEGRFFTESNLKPIYRQRFWRKSVFEGVDLIKAALNEAYGDGKVSPVTAAFRWLNHHSQLCSQNGDGVIVGASSLDQLKMNLTACQEGPLEKSVVEAFDQAWDLEKPHCATYYR